MKKVLIITYYWPPTGGGGVQRWLKFAKYLREFNWEPIIYTPQNPERPETDESLLSDLSDDLLVIKRKIHEPYRLYKWFTGKKADEKIRTAFLSEKKTGNSLMEKISLRIRGDIFIPDARRFWIKPSVRFLQTYLKEHPVDAIVSTGPPHSMHLIAMRLRDMLRIPWLADFRDPWTNIDFYHALKLSHRADLRHHRLEKEVLLKADAVTVVSHGMLLEYEQTIERPYKVITNGYDESDLVHAGEPQPDPFFSIAHIGSLVKTRNPLILWEVLSKLSQEIPEFGEHLRIKIVGKMDFEVRESIAKAGLEDQLIELDYLPHPEVISEQLRSQVLLLLINNTPNAHLILTGKIFEYIHAQRPILCIGPVDGDAARLISETASGFCSGFKDAESLEEHLRELFNRYQQNDFRWKNRETAQYSRRNLTKVMAKELNRIVNLSESGQQTP